MDFGDENDYVISARPTIIANVCLVELGHVSCRLNIDYSNSDILKIRKIKHGGIVLRECGCYSVNVLQ
jgi:hypothetical protein